MRNVPANGRFVRPGSFKAHANTTFQKERILWAEKKSFPEVTSCAFSSARAGSDSRLYPDAAGIGAGPPLLQGVPWVRKMHEGV